MITLLDCAGKDPPFTVMEVLLVLDVNEVVSVSELLILPLAFAPAMNVALAAIATVVVSTVCA